MSARFVSVNELAAMEGVHPSTIRRFAGLVPGYPRKIDYRRRGPGRRSPIEFNAAVAREQLRRLRERESPTGSRPAPGAPMLVEVLTEVRELRRELAEMREKLSV